MAKKRRSVKATLKRAAKAATSLIPSKYIPAQIRRDPKTGKIKVKLQPTRLKRSTRTRK